jgi:hypothetical protein
VEDDANDDDDDDDDDDDSHYTHQTDLDVRGLSRGLLPLLIAAPSSADEVPSLAERLKKAWRMMLIMMMMMMMLIIVSA